MPPLLRLLTLSAFEGNIPPSPLNADVLNGSPQSEWNGKPLGIGIDSTLILFRVQSGFKVLFRRLFEVHLVHGVAEGVAGDGGQEAGQARLLHRLERRLSRKALQSPGI